MSRRIKILLVAVAVALAGCTRQLEVTPTPTATPVLSHEEMARQLTRRVTDNLKRLSQLNTLCDNVLNGGINAYHEAVRDTFAGLVALPESRLLNELQIIFTQGIEQASDVLPPSAQPGQAVAPKLTGQTLDGHEVILAIWGNAPCHPSGHVHHGTDLYVFDTAGQVLFEGGAESLTVYPAVSGWIVVGSYGPMNAELWHISGAKDQWNKAVMFRASHIGLSVKDDARNLEVGYDTVTQTPPCRLVPQIAARFDHMLISDGHKEWVWRDDGYVLSNDTIQDATICIGPGGAMWITNWRQYCME